ncbi:aminopeptidase [Haloarchaeobius amylolyticus]|uniref:aminopeptidase n=1 Tax=Haloarchaeobius amylolyticus TaxID=1198296 RepID=UPI00226EE291|nr:aminopeptidase [Haloarchaeobius amylolyticus]
MDERVREHARILVEKCTDIQQGDCVAINAPAEAEDLAVAIAERLGEKGAHPTTNVSLPAVQRAYMLAADEDDFETPAHIQAMAENTDAFISVKGSQNMFETSDVPPAKNQARAKHMKPIQEAYMDSKWVVTQYPCAGDAQKAEMSTPAYEDFVWGAINKDWDEQHEFQENMVEILDDASEVRIVSGETTDVTMSVAGNHAINDTAENNMPGGEVFTAPVPDSVEGEVLFDKPLMAQGREVTGVWLKFEEGEVVEHSAEKNEEVLTAQLNTDEGSKRLGELGIGMNRDIDRFTYNMLFDEKMGDTVHMAIGRAYEENVGEDNEQNQSVVHTDMIVDMSEDSFIEVDGEVVQRNGTFRFEDGFEG